MQYGINVDGADKLEKNLLNLERKTARKFLRQSIRAGAKIINAQQKSNARSMIGGEMGRLIANSYKVRNLKAFRKGEKVIGSMIIDKTGKLGGKSKNGNSYWIPAAIEYGHAFPGRGGRGAPKDVPPNPFGRKAFESHKERARKTAITELWNKIEATARTK